MSGALELSELARRVSALPAPRLLAFDVDGTLAPIVADPAAAAVPEHVQSDMRALCALPDVRVALVTGRDLAGLSRMASVPGAYRAVEHGALIVSPSAGDAVPALSSEQQSRLDRFTAWADAEAVPLGAWLEHKRQSRGIHVRALAERDANAAQQILDRAAAAAERLGLHARLGRAVLEAELSPGDKGQALAQVQEVLGARGVLYVGDDLTDLPAIEHAVAQGGVGLFVTSAERPHAPAFATGSLAGPDGVHALLKALLKVLTA